MTKIRQCGQDKILKERFGTFEELWTRTKRKKEVNDTAKNFMENIFLKFIGSFENTFFHLWIKL